MTVRLLHRTGVLGVAICVMLLSAGCEFAQSADTPPVAAPAPVAADAGDLDRLAAELNESEAAASFYYALQYAAVEAQGPALYAHVAPRGSVDDPRALREAFCADLGEGAETCLALSAQADALAEEAELDLVTLGVATVAVSTFERAAAGFDFAGPRCPPPPDPLGAFDFTLPTYAPFATFAVEPAVDEETPVLALRFSAGETSAPAERLEATLRDFRAIEKPKCPTTGCRCIPPRDD